MNICDEEDMNKMGIYDWEDMRQFDNIDLRPKKRKRDPNAEEFEASNEKRFHQMHSKISSQPWDDQAVHELPDEAQKEWKNKTEASLAETFGVGVMVIKNTIQGKPGYYCQVCRIESNSLKATSIHCSGMKHVKRMAERELECPSNLSRSTYDASIGARNLKDPSAIFVGDKDTPYPVPGGSQPRSNEELQSRLMSMASGTPINRPTHTNTEARARDSYQVGAQFERYPSNYPRHESYPPTNHSESQTASPYGERRQDSFRGPADRDRAPSSAPYDHNHPPSRQTDDYRTRFPTPAPPPPKMGPPSPPKVCLKPTPVGTLLDKMSTCCVDTVDDYELAMDVLSALLKSLKEHNIDMSNQRCTELLMEAELKVGTVKVLSSLAKNV